MASFYLNDIPLPDALKIFDENLDVDGLNAVLGEEEIPLNEKAVGRVLAAPVWARLSSPHYHASAMDGFAVRSQDTVGALQTAPLSLSVPDQASYLDTGDPLPDWADAVIPIEETEPVGVGGQPAGDPRAPDSIQIRGATPPWKHIRALGEDMVATQLVLPAGHLLRPVDLGAAAAAGHMSVIAARRPTVAIIPSGTELVPIGSEVKPGDVIEFNSVVLAAQIESWGGDAVRFPAIPDEPEIIRKQLSIAAETYDLVLILAGSSAGSEDYSAGIISDLGDLLVHGVAVRPGHPVIIGMLANKTSGRTPVIGIPGYPVSSALTGEIFIEPLISRWLGRLPRSSQSIKASITRKITSPAGDDDYVRVVVGEVAGKVLAAPLTRGAGVITSLVRADGIVILPQGSQGVSAGAEVDVRLYRNFEEIQNTILVSGSHDLTLDLIAQFLSPHNRRFSSANVGSVGGLVALRKEHAHLAGSHLLDPQSGEYNLPYLTEYLPETSLRVYELVQRQQGLLIQKGNPKGIQNIKDLQRPDVVYVNRQRGAGTRILLDFQMDLKGIVSDDVQGYNHEEFTHLAVAAVISSGRADCGLGIAAAANALDLDFIPLHQERYDLIIPTKFAQQPLLEPLFKVLANPEFARMVQALPGYDAGGMGNLVAEIN